MKKLAILTTVSMTTLLAGCMATSYVSGKSFKFNEQTVELTDTFLAIGKPKTPIAGHQTALVMAGEKNNYLVEGRFKEDEQEMTDIFGHLDLNYVRIERMEKIQRNRKDYVTTVNLRYSKPKNQVTAKEFEITQKINGLNCSDGTPENGNVVHYSCPLSVTVNIIPMKKPENQILQHKFSTPIKAEFYSDMMSPKPILALFPLAIAVDIVTFPVQAIGAVAVTSILIMKDGGIKAN